MHTPFCLYSTQVLLEDGLTPATLLIEAGKIKSITKGKSPVKGLLFSDKGNKVIMPGLIDSHVHINEPGRTDWEGFDTATKAAAAGGITTLIDMPLNSSPVTTTAKAFKEKLAATKGKLHVNCGFWGGIVPDNLEDLEELLAAGVLGLKAFLTHSGIDEFPNVNEAEMRTGMLLAKKHNIPFLAHCELDAPHPGIESLKEHPTSYVHYLHSRPKSWENKAVDLMIRLCEETGCKTHIVHLSSAEGLPAVREARAKGLPLTVETCPHYLCFAAETIPDRAIQFKCAPPIREWENNVLLWEALAAGDLDFVVTDHSPAPPEVKQLDSGDFSKAWGGIAGIQFSLPVMWTALRKRGHSLGELSSWMSGAVASFLGMDTCKGKLAVGYDADIVVFDPDSVFRVEEDLILHRHKITPYLGMELSGIVLSTYVNGELVFDDGAMCGLDCGMVLLKTNN